MDLLSGGAGCTPAPKDEQTRRASRLLELRQRRGLQGQSLRLEDVLSSEASGLANTVLAEAGAGPSQYQRAEARLSLTREEFTQWLGSDSKSAASLLLLFEVFKRNH